jgi:hypothetical protein
MTERHRHVPNSSRRSPPASHASHDFAVLAPLRDRLPFSFRMVLIVYHKNSDVIHNSLLCIIGETQSMEISPTRATTRKRKKTLT